MENWEDSVNDEESSEDCPIVPGKVQIKKRKCYSLSQKIEIASQYQANVSGKGFAAIAKANGIDSKTVRRWYKDLDKMKNQVSKNSNSIRKMKRLPGGGKRSEYPEIDKHCFNWIKERNKEGLRVGDKNLQFEAINFAEKAGISNFKASSGWINCFKNRFAIASRRHSGHTTTRSLPEP